jgi:ATP-binding cassette subfamily B protein
MYLVKAFGKERQEIRNYLKVLISNIRISLKNTRLEVFSSFAGGSFDRLIIGLISLFGGYQVIRGRISLGTLTAIMIYLNQLIGMQGSITSFFQRIIFNMVSCRRIEEVLEKASEKENRPGTEKIALEHPQIQFKKLSFGYNSGEYILRGLDFKIDKGSVALAGPSGCGKTTIINLLLGLYEPWEGQVFIQGQNIRDINHFLLREEIGVALQEPYLWNDSIENNIKYARQNATKGELTEVAKITGVDEFVKNLPAGYGSIIGENACKLSEGQKQKIAIARALLKKPKILILDEAMSSMDSLSEERIINEIKKESWIHTVIIVSHRLSTIMACDLAYFLKNPDKIIIDNPQKLLDTDGDFYNLFAAQIKEPLLKDAVNPLVQSIPEQPTR